MTRFVALLALMGMGCAGTLTTSPRLPKSGVRLVWGDQVTIFQACGGEKTRSDKGRFISYKDDIVACWDASTRTIFAEDSERGAKAAALHERAHEEGVKDPGAAGFTWD